MAPKRDRKPTAAAAEAAEEAEKVATAKTKRSEARSKKAQSQPPVKLKIKGIKTLMNPPPEEDPVQAQQKELDAEDNQIADAPTSSDDAGEDEEEEDLQVGGVEDTQAGQIDEVSRLKAEIAMLKGQPKKTRRKRAPTIDLDDDESSTQPAAQTTGRPKKQVRIDVLDSEEEARQKEKRAKQLDKELSEVEYAVHIKAKFEEVVILEDTLVHRILGPSRFDYRHLSRFITTKMKDHADVNNVTCYHIRTGAVLTWYKQTAAERVVTSLNESGDYDLKMIPRLKSSQQSPVRKELMVHIDVQYHRNVNGQLPASAQPPKPLPLKELKRLEQEQKMKDREEEKQRRLDSADSEKRKLITEYRCTDSLCPNYKPNESAGGYCYPFNQGHYRMKQEDIDDWMTELEQKKANVAKCPDHIRVRLKRMVRKKPDQKPHSGDPVNNLMAIWASKSIAEIERPKHRRRRSYTKSTSSDESSASERKSRRRSRRKHRRSRDSRSRHVTPPPTAPPVQPQSYSALSNVLPPSSPVKLKGSASSSVTDFISWVIHDHMELGTSKSELKERKDFIQAGRMLLDKGFDLQVVQSKKNSSEAEQWWELRGVKPGIGVRLARYAKEYEKWVKEGGHGHSTRPNVLESSDEESSLVDGMRSRWLVFYFALISYRGKIRWLPLFLVKDTWLGAR